MRKELSLIIFLLFSTFIVKAQIKLGATEDEAIQYWNSHKEIFSITSKEAVEGKLRVDLKQYQSYSPVEFINFTYIFKSRKCIQITKWIPVSEIGYALSEYNKTPKENRIYGENFEAAWITLDSIFINIPHLWYSGNDLRYKDNFYALIKEPITNNVRTQLNESRELIYQKTKKEIEEQTKRKNEFLKERKTKVYSYQTLNSDLYYVVDQYALTKNKIFNILSNHSNQSGKESLDIRYLCSIDSDTLGKTKFTVIPTTTNAENSNIINEIENIKMGPAEYNGVYVTAKDTFSISYTFSKVDLVIKKTPSKYVVLNKNGNITPEAEKKWTNYLDEKNGGKYYLKVITELMNGKKQVSIKETSN